MVSPIERCDYFMTLRIEIPRDEQIDSTLCLLKEGYRFIPNRRRKLQSDLFETTLFGQKVICMSGKEAAEVFYQTDYFKRKGAAPKRIQKTLFGEHGVQTLDDESHKRRKALFMSLFTPEHLDTLKQITSTCWEQAFLTWEPKSEINLFQEAKKIMCQVACQWANVPLKETEIENVANDLWSLIDAFGAVGVRYWQGRVARKRCERWIEKIISSVRSGITQAEKNTPLFNIAFYNEQDGKNLDIKVAAVELINILRPIVAISLYITFGALALYQYPKVKKRLQQSEDDYTRMFTQEVRRFYPFTPFVGARVRNEFLWSGHLFKPNTLVLLDVYGMNHDHRIWGNPSEFAPERFAGKNVTKYDFIPQGGGEFIKNHRCAGEIVTITVMEQSFDFLARKLSYTVPKQKLDFSLNRMPPMLKTGFIITDLTRRE